MFALLGHTLGTPHLTVIDALELFARCGLDGAEVIWQSDYLSGIPEGDEGAAKAVSRRARELGLSIGGLTPYMTGLNSLDDSHRDRDLRRFEDCIRTAETLGCHRIRAYAGDWDGTDPAAHPLMWQRLVESLRTLGERAIRHGVVLCVENHFNTMTVSARETARLVAEVSSAGVGALYDQANLAFTHQEDFERAIELQGPWIRHVHVKDVEVVDASKPFKSRTVSRVDESERAHRSRVIGEGQLDWPGILRRLASVGYRGALSLEYEYRWHPQDLPSPEVGIRTSAERLRSMVATMDAIHPEQQGLSDA